MYTFHLHHQPPQLIACCLRTQVCMGLIVLLRLSKDSRLYVLHVYMAVRFCNNVMLQDPNPDDPLNKEAAQEMQSNPRQFEYNVKNSIVKGAYINNVFFPPAKDT